MSSLVDSNDVTDKIKFLVREYFVSQDDSPSSASRGDMGPDGPTGPSGIQGQTGLGGVRGLFGEMGTQGPTGPPGSVGPVGTIPGPQGPTGPSGPTGPVGDVGQRGVIGVPGPGGPPGNTGPTGPQGLTGATGPTGATGAVGSTGPTGASGPTPPGSATGEKGATGPYGTNGVYPGTIGVAGETGRKGSSKVISWLSPLTQTYGIGFNASSSSGPDSSISIGAYNNTIHPLDNTGSISIGYNTVAGSNGIALGSFNLDPNVTSFRVAPTSIVIGNDCYSEGSNSVLISNSSTTNYKKTHYPNSFCLGDNIRSKTAATLSGQTTKPLVKCSNGTNSFTDGDVVFSSDGIGSDIRIKENIKDASLSDMSNFIEAIRLTSFIKDDGKEKEFGVIANEIKNLGSYGNTIVSSGTDYIYNINKKCPILVSEKEIKVHVTNNNNVMVGDSILVKTNESTKHTAKVIHVSEEDFTLENSFGLDTSATELYIAGKKTNDFLSVDTSKFVYLLLATHKHLLQQCENKKKINQDMKNRIEIIKKELDK